MPAEEEVADVMFAVCVTNLLAGEDGARSRFDDDTQPSGRRMVFFLSIRLKTVE
jgi:hypothetical protein